MGEGKGGGGQNEDLLAPLPFIPSHRREGRFWGEYVKSTRDSSVNPFYSSPLPAGEREGVRGAKQEC